MSGFHQIFVCATPGCDASGETRCGEKGGVGLLEAFRAEAAARGLDEDVVVQRQPCSRRHHEGPVVFVFPDDAWYTQVEAGDVPEIFDRHMGGPHGPRTGEMRIKRKGKG